VIGARRPARRVVIARPLVIGGRVVGAAGATLAPQPLLVQGAPVKARLALLVRDGRDTIAVLGKLAGASNAFVGYDTITVPGGTRWTVEALHDRGSTFNRWSRGTVALLALIFLGAGLLRERRQAVRIAERSAELERLSSELLRANRMKSEFLANVSHELRTPLNAIVGFVELLRDGVYGELSPRQAQPVERIAASAMHLRGLVDQVLDIAKMAAGRLEVHPEPIVLRPFVLNVMSELESLVAEKGLSLSISVGASLPRVRTDPAHLRSIVVNLVGNAIKYTPSGGIVVRARLVGAPRPPQPAPTPAGERTLMEEAALAAAAPSRDHPWIALQVIDTGIGIAPEDRERIFDEFEQVNAGPRGESMQRGTGLGLAITRRLARLLGGDVRVDSEQGKGSAFTVWMPVSPADLEARRAI
jgi:signal transduction histidine kinase